MGYLKGLGQTDVLINQTERCCLGGVNDLGVVQVSERLHGNILFALVLS